jgi:hypothetical protein
MEFLSSPRVLVQVMHFPGVLYQWLVAAHAEVLRFEKQITDFQFLPFPETCQENVKLLIIKLMNLKLYIDNGFEQLKNLILNHSVPNLLKSFNEHRLDWILSELIEVNSEQGQNDVKALKRSCWNDPANKGKLMLPPKKCCYTYPHSKLHFRQIYRASGLIEGNLSFSAKDIQLYVKKSCQCAECSKTSSKINQERSDFFKNVLESSNMETTRTKMLQFYNNHLKERFPGVKYKCILAHLVNKEMLYLHWKYEAIESTIIFFLSNYPN